MALNKKRIVEQSLQLLNEDGLEGVTLRKLAKRLKVQPSALYWHVDNKEALINEMAEAILQTVFPTYLPQDENGRWQDGLIEVFRRLRKALLSYKDGGRVVAGAHFSTMLAKLSEEAIKATAESGESLHMSRLYVLIATRYTFGYVIEEQNTPSDKAVEKFDVDRFKKEHPLTVQGIEAYFSKGRTNDDLFIDGLSVIFGDLQEMKGGNGT